MIFELVRCSLCETFVEIYIAEDGTIRCKHCQTTVGRKSNIAPMGGFE